MLQALRRHGVTIVHFVPSPLAGFLEEVERRPGALSGLALRLVCTSGEALGAEQVAAFRRLAARDGLEASLVNLYGPTEATVDVHYYETAGDETVVPIGAPIAEHAGLRGGRLARAAAGGGVRASS